MVSSVVGVAVVLAIDWLTLWDSAPGVVVVVGAVVVAGGGALVWVVVELLEASVTVDWLPGV